MIAEKINQIITELGGKAELVIAVKYANFEQIKEIVSIHPKIAFNTYQQFREISEKINLSNLETHFIGNIQSNKIRKIIELNPSLIQSVNSLEIAEKINQICMANKCIQDILLQVNTDFDKKAGFPFDEFEKIFEKVNTLPNLRIRGIMTIPPEKEKIGEEKLKEIFQKMKVLKEKYNFQILSMGMSEDYLLAVETGSNMVRIGRKVFI